MRDRIRAFSYLLLLVLPSCGMGLCVGGADCGGEAKLSLGAGAIGFGARGFGTINDVAYVLSNGGRTPATEIAVNVLPSPFSYAGGTYPGTGGTCGSELAGGESCTVVLRYSAPTPPEGSSSAAWELAYFDGIQYSRLSIPITGSHSNGSFNQARGLDYAVDTIVVGNGGVYLGGSFTSNSNQKAGRILYVPASGPIPSWGEGFDNDVSAIAPAGDVSGDVYVGGIFTAYDGTTNVNRIARLNSDGTLDAGFDIGTGAGAGFNSNVGSIAPAVDGSGDVYVAGSFTTYNGSTNVNRIARLNSNGTLDLGFNIGSGAGAGFDATVYSVVPAGDGTGDVYVAGNFTTYNGSTNVNRIARLNSDGTIDAGFNIGSGIGAGFNGTVRSMARAMDGSGDVYVGGSFTTYNGSTNVNRVARLNSDGSLDTGFNIGAGAGAGFNTVVYSLSPSGDGSGDVYFGGNFTAYNGSTNLNYVARLNSDGTLDSGFNIGSGAGAGFGDVVYSVAAANDGSGGVYVGGFFYSYNGTVNVNHFARLHRDGILDTGFNIGGGYGSGFADEVYAVAPANDGSGAVYVGGYFLGYNGTVDVNFFTRLNSDGTIDTSFNIGTGASAGFSSWVEAVSPALDGSGDVYVGGNFMAYQGTANVNFVTRLNRDGSLDTGFNIGTGFTAEVLTLVAANDGSGDVYCGGSFTTYNGTANVRHIARLNSNGTLDTGFNIGSGAGAGFNSQVYIIALTNDGSGDIYVGGNFTTYNGNTNKNRIVRLNSDGSLDAGFNIGSGAGAGFNAGVEGIAVATDGSGDVYVGGTFITYNGTTNVNRIARLNSDGTLDAGFNIGSGAGAGFNTQAMTVELATDGSGDLLVGGAFTTYNGVANVNAVARLNPDGTLDTGFNMGTGHLAGFGSAVTEYLYAIAPANDGSGDIYFGGYLYSYNGNTHQMIARLSATGTPD